MTVRAKTYPGIEQRMQVRDVTGSIIGLFKGFVVGFSGNKVFCLHLYAMTAVEVPFSNQLFQLLEHGEYEFVHV